MATSIGKLSIILSANTTKFTKGMARASARVGKFAKGIGGAAAKAAKFGAAMGAVALAGLAVMLKKSFATIDATAKLADVLGFTTEQLVGLQHAAGIAGVSNEALSTGLRRLQKNISDAGVGLTTSIRAFEALGLEFDDLEKMSPDEQFKTIADAMGTMTSQTDKVRVSQDLFGRSGVQLLKIMEGGSEGIAQMQAEAERLGLTFSRIDAAKIEMANDAMTRLGAVITGAAQTLAIQFAPFIEAAATKLTELGMSGEGMGAKVVGAFEWILKAIAKVRGWIDAIKASFLDAQAGVTKGISLMIWHIEKLGGIWDKAFGFLGFETNIGGFTAMLRDELDTAAAVADEAADKLFESFTSGDREREVTDFFDDLRKKAEENAKKIVDAIPPILPAEEIIQDVENVVAKITDVIKKNEDTLGSMQDGPGEFEQVSLSRIAMSGVGRQANTQPKAKQIDKTNNILASIDSKVGFARAG